MDWTGWVLGNRVGWDSSRMVAPYRLSLCCRFFAKLTANLATGENGNMVKVVGCLLGAHDLRLVAVAATICALASFTAVQLLCHAHRSESRLRTIWLVIAALACGFGIWATHFVAMLSFSPGVPNGYDWA